ncbi:Alkaline phosphatase synthesis sensor protein PhoR [subsurface metagenome]
MEILYRGAIRLKELVDNLLDASILDADKFELKLNNENFVEIIKGSVNEMAHLASVREIGLNMDVPDALFFDVDKLRLRQAINNLISNAIKNTPIGGKVSIALIDKNNFVDIKVKDSGVGIIEKEKEKLFEKFGKIERYGMNLDVDIEGSGLGLYISKEIVELHGGRILVESEGRHKGSTFTIRLFRNR